MKPILSVNKIFDVFKNLSEESDFSAFRLLCSNAGRSIVSRMKNPDNALLYEEELCYAAGVLAFYRYVLLHGSDGVSTYKAGDITLHTRSSFAEQNAQKLLEDAFLSVADLLYDGGFCFKSV